MIITIYNKKKLDSISMKADSFDEFTNGYISFLIHSNGWNKSECEIGMTITTKERN